MTIEATLDISRDYTQMAQSNNQLFNGQTPPQANLMSFVAPRDSRMRAVSAMSLSSNRKLLAVGERTVDPPGQV